MRKPTANSILIKCAMRREMKELAKDTLSPEDVNRLVENNRGMLRERLIRPIGHGGSMNVDLVMHPEYGVAVRKQIRDTKMDVIDKIRDINIYDDVATYQKEHGPSGFAQVFGVEPRSRLVFQEYVKGPDIQHLRRQDPIWMEAARKQSPEYMGAVQAYEKVKAGINPIPGLLEERAQEILDWEARLGRNDLVPMDIDQTKLVNSLRKKYPGVFDYNSPWNVIKAEKNSKSIPIDVSAGWDARLPWEANVHTRYMDADKFVQFKNRPSKITTPLPTPHTPATDVHPAPVNMPTPRAPMPKSLTLAPRRTLKSAPHITPKPTEIPLHLPKKLPWPLIAALATAGTAGLGYGAYRLLRKDEDKAA